MSVTLRLVNVDYVIGMPNTRRTSSTCTSPVYTRISGMNDSLNGRDESNPKREKKGKSPRVNDPTETGQSERLSRMTRDIRWQEDTYL